MGVRLNYFPKIARLMVTRDVVGEGWRETCDPGVRKTPKFGEKGYLLHFGLMIIKYNYGDIDLS
jgi:hypothetical protein